jgi:hypothetical protein
MANTYKLQIPAGLYLWNDDCVRCDDCQRWAYEGETIVHSSRCDTPNLQAEYVVIKTDTTTTIANVEVPTVSDGGAIDWSKIKRGSAEWEAAQFEFGHGDGNFDLI